MAAPLPSWRYPDRPTAGSFEGAEHGSGVSFFVVDMAPGRGSQAAPPPVFGDVPAAGGPRPLRARPRVDRGCRRDVVVAPAETAHRFEAIGSERLRLVSIHAAARIETTWMG